MNILIPTILYISQLVQSLFVNIFRLKYPKDLKKCMMNLLNLLQMMDEFSYLLNFKQSHAQLLKFKVLNLLVGILFLKPEGYFCHLLEQLLLLLVSEELSLLLLGLLYLLYLLVPRLQLHLLKPIQLLFSFFHQKHLFLIYINEGLPIL